MQPWTNSALLLELIEKILCCDFFCKKIASENYEDEVNIVHFCDVKFEYPLCYARCLELKHSHKKFMKSFCAVIFCKKVAFWIYEYGLEIVT